jgi:hypothetical protein
MLSKYAVLPLAALAATSAVASCPSAPRTAAGVVATEHRWVAALEHRDSAALECILAPRFTDTSWRGEQISRAQVMKALPTRPASTLDLTELRPMLIGDVATVRGVNTQRSGSHVIGSVRFVDLFVYRSGRWQAVSAQETPIRAPEQR